MRYVFRFIATLVAFSLLGSGSAKAAGEASQGITLDGMLYSDTSFTNPLLDTNATINVKIYNPALDCILYEEQHNPVNTTATAGRYTIKVGSITGAAQRTGDDPNNAMADIFQNVAAIPATNAGCGGYTPSSGDDRFLRVTVTPSSTGVPQTLVPDLRLTSVPNALVCESIQGISRTDLIGLINGTDASALHHHDGRYAQLTNSASMTMASQSSIGLGAYTSGQETTYTGTLGGADAGKMWWNSTTSKMMYWDGFVAQEVGTGAGGVTTVFGRAGAVVAATSDYDAVQVDNTAAGNISATNVQAAIDELDAEKLALAGGTMSGAIAMGTNKITGLGDGSAAQDAATMNNLSSAITANNASYVAKAGDTMTGALELNNSSQLRLHDDAGTEYISFQAPNGLASNFDYTLPANYGTNTHVLTTDGAGGLTWTAKTSNTDTQNTLDQAYDEGGSGVGRAITVDTGAVQFTGSNAADETLEVTQSGNGGAMLVENTGTGDSFRVNDEAADASPFLIDASGNVGIGTGSPGYQLDVEGTGAASTIFSQNNTATGYSSVASGYSSSKAIYMDFFGASYSGAAGSVFEADYGALTAGTTASGLNLATASASGTIKLYTGGIAAANERMRIDAAGNVGIGTSSPTSSQLHVYRNSPQVIRMQGADTAGYIELRDNSDVLMGYIGYAEPGQVFTDALNNAVVIRGESAVQLGVGAGADLTVSSTGRVGIGTTTPAANLEIEHSNAITNIFSRNGEIMLQNTDATVGTWTGIESRSPSGSIAAGISFQNYDPGNNYANISFSTRGSSGFNRDVLVVRNREVGVGTLTPSSRFHVFEGELTLNGTGAYLNYQPNNVECGNNEVLKWDATNDHWICGTDNAGAGAQTLDETYNQAGNTVAVDAQDVIFNLTSTLDFQVQDNGAAAFSVNENGNVGVGLFNPTANLHVVDDVAGLATLLRLQNSDGNINQVEMEFVHAGQKTYIGSDRTANNFGADLYFSTNDSSAGTKTEWMRITETGNIGIGTATPTQKLHVNSGTTNVAALFENTDASAKIRVADTSGSAYVSTTGGTAYFGASSIDSNNIAVLSSGNVGIGAITPSSKLHVSAGELTLNGAGAYFNYQPNNVECANNEVLKWDDTNDRWICGTDNAGAGAQTMDGTYDQGGNTVAVDAQDLIFNLSSTQDFHIQDNGAAAFTVLDNGRVGVGDSNPAHALSVNGNIHFGQSQRILSTANSGNPMTAVYYHSDAGDNTLRLGGGTTVGEPATRIEFFTHPTVGATGTGTNTMTILGSNGNVGIGTSSPVRTLDVDGTIRAAGSDAFWTTANWGRSIEMEQGFAILWQKGASGVARGVGSTSDGHLYIARSDENDNSAAVAYDMIVKNDGSVGIGTVNPDASALLDIASLTKGFLPPRMTTAQRDAIGSPAEGLTIYNTTTDKLNVVAGGAWTEVGGGAGFGTGNSGYIGSLHMPGTASPCVWSTTSNTYVAYTTNDNDCNAATVDGAALAPTEGKIPAIRFASLPAGRYRVDANVHMVAQTAGSCFYQLWDGTNGSSVVDVQVVGNKRASYISGEFSYSTAQSNITFYVRATDTNTGSTCDIRGDNLEKSVRFSVERIDGNTSAVQVADNDGDTAVYSEKSTDEDILRFDAGGNEVATMNASGVVEFGNNAELRIRDDAGTEYISFKSPTGLAGNVDYTLPPDDGNANEVLQTDGAGVLTWVAQSGGAPTSRDLIAGTGMTGGGDLTADRTFNVIGGDGIVANADDIAVDFTTDKGLHFVANKLEVEAGSGISLDANGVNVDVNGLTAETTPDGAADTVMIYDDSASALRKMTINNLTSLVGGNQTLDQVYDQGGNNVTVDAGAIQLTGSNAADETLEVTQSGNGGALLVENAGTGISFRVNDEASDTTPFVVNADGNVGIGTAAPALDLHLSNSTSFRPQIVIENTNNDANGGYLILDKAPPDDTLASGDSLGTVLFRGEDTSGTIFNSSYIASVVTAQNASSVDSKLRFHTTDGGTTAVAMILRGQSAAIGGGDPNTSALLDVNSTTKGFLPPRMTTAQRTGISSPAEGLIVFDTDEDSLFVYQNASWEKLANTTDVSFLVTKSGAQSIPGNTWTKVTWNLETFDSNSNFASDRFTPTVPGKYWLGSHIRYDVLPSVTTVALAIYKNGSFHSYNTGVMGGSTGIDVDGIVEANGTTDYFEIYAYTGTAEDIQAGAVYNKFYGFLISGGTGGGGSADHMGNHTASQNIILGSHYLSGDGDNEGIQIDASGNVSLAQNLTLTGNVDMSGATIADNSISLDDLDFGSTAGGINVPQLASAPTGTTEGQMYFNTGDKKLYVWDGSAWQEVGSGNTTIGGYEIVTNNVAAGAATGWYSAVCPAGKQVLGGSCHNSNGAVAAVSHAEDSTTYSCYKHNTANTWEINAICAYTTPGAAIAVVGDSDDDTKIQVEESTDEDIIRFDTAGTERMVINNSGNVGIGTTNPRTEYGTGMGTSPLYMTLSSDGATQTSPSILGLSNPVASPDNTASAGSIQALLAGQGSTPNSRRIGIIGFGADGSTAGAYGGYINFAVKADNDNVSGPAEAMRIVESGNVGIGTASPTSLLHLRGTDKILNIENTASAAGSGGVLRFGHDQASNQTPIGEIRGELTNGGSGTRAGDLSFWTSGGGTLSEAMRIDENGNVGIGTTSPGKKLHVSGTTSTNIRVESTGTDGNAVGFQIMGGAANANWSISTNSSAVYGAADSLGFYKNVGNTGPKMVISDSGNVGIGTTAPSRQLTTYFNNGNASTSAFIVEQDGAGDAWMNFWLTGGVGYAVGIDNSDGDKFKIGYNSTSATGVATNTRLTIDTTGNVGIGTTNPTHKLTVGGGTIAMDNNTGLVMKTSSGAQRLFFSVDGSDQLRIGNTGAGDGNDSINFQVTGIANALMINSSGNVGIGTASPDAPLHVDGDIKLGDSSATCNSTTEGSQRYNSTSKKMEFCNGTTWAEIGGGSPAGAIQAFSQATCPSGWLAANGAAVSRTTYATLFGEIGVIYGNGNGSTTFNLPDYRGYFLRGWDNGAGRDPDAASRTNRGDGTTGDNVGTKQGDAFDSHNHGVNDPGHNHSSATGGGGNFAAGGFSTVRGFANNTGTDTTGITIQNSGGSETRPDNINVLYCIKY